MLILIDGYNVIAPVVQAGQTPKSDWLHQERMRLLIRLAENLDHELAINTCVVFDAATRRRGSASAAASQHGSTSRFRGIEVRFAIDHDEADDLIEELIAVHSSPKRLTVVSSDHRLQAAARRSGALAFDSDHWLDALLDGQVLLAVRWPRESLERDGADGETSNPRLHDPKSLIADGTTVEEWMRAFGISPRTALPSRPAEAAAQPVEQPPEQLVKAKPEKRKSGKTGKPQREQQSPESSTVPRQRRPEGGDPSRPLDSDNPFPDGYGEELL